MGWRGSERYYREERERYAWRRVILLVAFVTVVTGWLVAR